MSTSTKKRRAFRVYVDHAVCDGCGVCIFFCKPNVFELSSALNTRGVFPAEPARSPDCNNCRLCELACPQLAIFVRDISGQDNSDEEGQS